MITTEQIIENLRDSLHANEQIKDRTEHREGYRQALVDIIESLEMLEEEGI